MKDNIFLILFCVFFIILDTLVLGYSIGRIYPPILTMASTQTSTSNSPVRKEKQQHLPEKQEEKDNVEQQENFSEQTQEISIEEHQQITTITEQEAIKIVELDYQIDGHIVVMSEDDKSYTIGCFWEMYFDEHTGEPRYNMQAAEYVIDKYNGEIISVTKQENNTNNTMVQQEENIAQQTNTHIYTREEVNAMFNMDWVDGCGVYMEYELGEDIQDEFINGETCYIGNVVWGNGSRTRIFYVGNQSLKVYASDGEYVGIVTDDFASALELH